MIRKLRSGKYRLYSRKRIQRRTSAGIWEHLTVGKLPKKHEREVQYFKRK
jgi:hypothetical protein